MKKILLVIALLAVTRAAQAQNEWASGKTYVYDAAGNIIQIANDVYQYDSADRLVSGETNDRQRHYTYDAFGNRLDCTDVTSGGDCQPVNILSATNRVGGATFDAAGNLTQFGSDIYTYDAMNMLLRDTSAPLAREYVYTAAEERIAVIVGSTWNWTLRDASAKVLREMTSTAGAGGAHSNWQWTRDNVWRDGLLLASRQNTSGTVGTFHYHLDHLGTPRVVSNAGDAIVGNHDYFPFGMELSGNLDESPENRHKFTGHERDDFAGDIDPLDYMHARYYSGGWGRFTSPDPLFGNLLQPGSWNRYAYVLNDPIKFIDRYGLRPEQSPVRSSSDLDCRWIGDIWSCGITVSPDRMPSSMWWWLWERRNWQPPGSPEFPIAGPFTKSEDFEAHDVPGIPQMWHCVEGSLAPVLVGNAAIVSGAVVAGSGAVLAFTGVAAAAPSYGTSLIFVPAGGALMAGGGYLMVFGASVHINHINNVFGTNIPSPSSAWPKYFPAYPEPGQSACGH